jgi:ABC-type uncharacterized transport system substrate-binding protein
MTRSWHGGWLFLLLVMAGSAGAHPHAWIDLRVSVLFNAEGELRALQQEWVFDPSYSHLLLEGMDSATPGLDLDQALREIRERLLGNLRAYDYFTEMHRGEDALAIADAQGGTLSWERRRLHLQFELPVEPMRPDAARPLQYRVYDPSYWIEVLHDPDDVIHLHGGHGCQTRLERPRPDARLIAYAADLERQQRATIEDLGRAFAEQVFVHC